MLELRGRPAIVRRLARGQHQADDAVGVSRDGDLRICATGVVADQRDVDQLEPLQGRGNERSDTVGPEVGAARHRHAVRAERKIERETAEVVVQAVDHVSPQIGVHEPAVDEYQRRSATALEVFDGAFRQLQRLRLTQKRRPPAGSAHAFPSFQMPV